MVTASGPGRVRIAREELTERLAGDLRAGSVLITAGAGFGKSTAIELALAELGWPAATVSCEAGAGDPGRLLTRVVTAVQAAVPGVADVIADRLALGLGPVDVPAMTEALVADLETLPVDPLVLVIDDAEALAADRDGLALVSALLGARAPRLHVAVASRRPLRLRRAKLRAAGRLAELGERDLAFSPGECSAFLRERLGRAPDPDELEALVAATHGWPLGVALGAGGPTAVPVAGARGELFAFLAEEVLDHLPSPLRDQVLVAAVPAELDAPLLEALDLPGDLPARVRDAGLLLEPAAGDGRWRYHPLLHEFLLDRLAAERDDEEVAALRARAAAAEQAAGRTTEAVRLLLLAGRHEEAAAVIAETGPALMRTSWRTIEGWLATLPPPLRALPPLRFLEGQVLLAAGDHAGGTAALHEAEEGFRAAGVVPGEWAARWFRAASYHESGEWEEIAEIADDFDEGVAAAAGPPAMALGLFAAFAKAARGDLAGARGLAERVHAQPGSELVTGIDVGLRGYLDLPGGAVDDVTEFGRRVAARLERQDVLGLLPLVEGSLALMEFEIGRPEASLAAWDRTVAAVERVGANRGILVHAQIQRAIQLAWLGRVAEAERALALAHPLPEMGFRETWVHQARATIAWRRGQAREAAEACVRAYELLRGQRVTADRSWATLAIVPVLSDVGEVDRAHAYVDETLAFWDDVLPGDDGRFWRARSLAQRAWLRYARGDVDAAVEDLRVAWAMARGTEAHMLRSQWDHLRPLLWTALERGAIEPAGAVAAVRSVGAASDELATFLEHPAPEVRRAAIDPAAASGHPAAFAQLRALAAGAGRDARGATGAAHSPGADGASGAAHSPDAATSAAEVGAAARRALRRLAERPPPLAYTLLGGFGLRRGEWDVPPSAFGRPAAAALVRFLVVHRGTAVPEDDLFEALWPGRSATSARSSLRVALSRARAVLDPPEAAESRIASVQRTYRLRLDDNDRVDAEDFAAAATAARAARGPERVELLERAAALWTGEPLPEDRYADWALLWRNDLIDRHVDVLSSLVRARLQAGDNLAAVAAGRRLVDADRLNEESHVLLMLAYARAGNRSSALRQYLACRGVLVAELGLEPSRETQRLHRALLAGEPV